MASLCLERCLDMQRQTSVLQKIAPYSADVLDPFTLKCRLPFYQKVKAVLLTATLLPFRIVFMILILFLAWILAVIALKGLPEDQKSKKPLSGWRRNYIKPLVVSLSRFSFVVAGWHWISFKGKRASAKEAPILVVVPHTSFWDTVPVIALRCPGLVVRDATETTPIFGDLIMLTQPVFVRRDDPASRQHTVDEIRRRCLSEDDWEQVLIFPEGTCGNGKALLDFKLGAFNPGVPVQPVFIRYPNRLDTLTWAWDGPGAWRQIWLTLCQFHIYCEIEFLPVYYPSGIERENPRIYAENCRRKISSMCNIPMSYFSLDDVKYLSVAKAENLPKTVPLVKLLKMRKKNGRELLDVKTELTQLSEKLATMNDTMCNIEDFAKYIGCNVSEALKEFFHLMDQAKNGKIDARIYNAGLWLLRTNFNEWKRLENSFKLFDPKGVLTESEFAAVAFLWRGLPLKVSRDIFFILNFECKNKDTISFKTFKSVATSYMQLEKSSQTTNGSKNYPLKDRSTNFKRT